MYTHIHMIREAYQFSGLSQIDRLHGGLNTDRQWRCDGHLQFECFTALRIRGRTIEGTII